MAAMNRQLLPTMDTVFLTPSSGLQHVSSSFVREIATLGGDVSTLVAPSVHSRVQARVSQGLSA
jgi:pantetheine-phosphate adenylyltransferase